MKVYVFKEIKIFLYVEYTKKNSFYVNTLLKNFQWLPVVYRMQFKLFSLGIQNLLT